MVFANDSHGAGVVGTIATAAFAVIVGGGWIKAGAAVAGIAAGFRFFLFCGCDFRLRFFRCNPGPVSAGPPFAFVPRPTGALPCGLATYLGMGTAKRGLPLRLLPLTFSRLPRFDRALWFGAAV